MARDRCEEQRRSSTVFGTEGDRRTVYPLDGRVCGTPLGWVRTTSLVGLVTTTSVWGKESLPSAPLMSLGSDFETKRKNYRFPPTPYLKSFHSSFHSHPSQLPLPLTPLPLTTPPS
ncbi:hypothetical protein WN51_01263 [Melipona quadrifasciata]|uniref:Uncharacterized protein n=1 Tax=Melipona quadrifasciata TaxID=166423 RepID=A0A0N0BF82_9HYME|nr:hypothetical protein WN51_01263 [Melipona quadrifasciata]